MMHIAKSDNWTVYNSVTTLYGMAEPKSNMRNYKNAGWCGEWETYEMKFTKKNSSERNKKCANRIEIGVFPRAFDWR